MRRFLRLGSRSAEGRRLLARAEPACGSACCQGPSKKAGDEEEREAKTTAAAREDRLASGTPKAQGLEAPFGGKLHQSPEQKVVYNAAGEPITNPIVVDGLEVSAVA